MPPRRNRNQGTLTLSETRAYVYIALNPLFKGLKIGFSDRDPNHRVKEFNSAALPKKYLLRWFIFVERGAQQLERAAHIELSRYNIRPDPGCGVEWFDCELEMAIRTILELADTLSLDIVDTKHITEAEPPRQDPLPQPPPSPKNEPVADEQTIKNRIDSNKPLLGRKRTAGLGIAESNRILAEIKNGELAICDCLMVNPRPYPHSLEPFKCYQCNRLIKR